MSFPRGFRPLHRGSTPSADDFNRLLAEVERLTRVRVAPGMMQRVDGSGYTIGLANAVAATFTPKGCRLSTSGNSLVDMGALSVPWTEVIDEGGYFDSGSPTIITISEAGWYAFGCFITIDPISTSGYVRVAVGGGTGYATQLTPLASSGFALVTANTIQYLAPPLTFTAVEVIQVSGGTVDVDGEFWLVRLS